MHVGSERMLEKCSFQSEKSIRPGAEDISALQHLVCRVVQSLHTNHMQTSAYGRFNDTHLHMVGMQTLHISAY